jgi:hypothetical protein
MTKRPNVGTSVRTDVEALKRLDVDRQRAGRFTADALFKATAKATAAIAKRSPATLETGAPPKKKKKRAKLARTDAPIGCSILAVDAAECSGYAIWDRGVLASFGEVDVFGSEPAQVFDVFLRMSAPHVIVIERPFLLRSASASSIGAAEKIWREMAKRRSFAKRIVRVYPSTWRSVVLPRGMASAKRDVVRPVEMSYAQGVAHYHMGISQSTTVGPDSAPAILIGEWAAQAGEVLAVMPKVKPSRQLTLDGLPVKRPRKSGAA